MSETTHRSQAKRRSRSLCPHCGASLSSESDGANRREWLASPPVDTDFFLRAVTGGLDQPIANGCCHHRDAWAVAGDASSARAPIDPVELAVPRSAPTATVRGPARLGRALRLVAVLFVAAATMIVVYVALDTPVLADAAPAKLLVHSGPPG